MFAEKDMQDILVQHPEIIEEGMVFCAKEQVLYGRRIDIRLKDKNGNDVIVELKNTEITYEHIGQLIWYTGALIREGKKIPRSILIGRKVHPVLQTAFNHFGIEWRAFEPVVLIEALREKKSPLYSTYKHFDTGTVEAKKVRVSPVRTKISPNDAMIISESAEWLCNWFINTPIPRMTINKMDLLFDNEVESVVAGTGNWVGRRKRFKIINKKRVYEGTVYFGSSGSDGKEKYPEGKNPIYVTVDIGNTSKEGKAFQPSNHTFSLKIPLHEYIELPSGNIEITVPVKGPGIKEHRQFINSMLAEWMVPTSFMFKKGEQVDSYLFQFIKSVISVGLLKQSVKNRISYKFQS